MRRSALRDDQWDRIKDILPGREGHAGGAAADNRLFVEAVLFRFRAGVPWRGPRILGRSATGLREADLHILSKLGKQGLEWRLEPEAFAGREVGREDDLLDVLVG